MLWNTVQRSDVLWRGRPCSVIGRVLKKLLKKISTGSNFETHIILTFILKKNCTGVVTCDVIGSETFFLMINHRWPSTWRRRNLSVGMSFTSVHRRGMSVHGRVRPRKWTLLQRPHPGVSSISRQWNLARSHATRLYHAYNFWRVKN